MKTKNVESPLPVTAKYSAASRILLPFAVAIGCGLSVASAATTLTVTGAPVPDADDITQPFVDTRPPDVNWSGINMSANNYPVGNSFTTGSNAGGYVFNSLYVNVNNPGNSAVGQTFRINIYSLNTSTTPNGATSVFAGTGTLATVPTVGSYLGFTSDDGFLLAPNTTYAFTVTGTSGSNLGFGYDGNNEYADGRILRVITEGSPTVDYGNASYDMTFHLGLTAATIPEPASMALVALGGCLLLRRKRC